jgi:eukaryotic-like serine/threonine-protein kinase
MSSSLPQGIRLGRYELRSKLGEGGMGEVYLALDTELGRTVAIKILPEAAASDQTRLQRFIQEARAASALNHPHILTIYEVGSTGSSRFIATEFIDGETLRPRMNSGQMKLDEVLDIAIQVAGALAAAHAAGIVHRDVKPENVMIRRDSVVKVLDFGLAKLTQPEPAIPDPDALTRALNTEPGVVVGTSVYMSPEQAAGKPVDARTDVWSLGVMLYEMIARRQPFAGTTQMELLARVLESEPVPLRHHAPETPLELQRIINKALVKDPDKRYQTIKDLLLDLKALKEELDFEAKLGRASSSQLDRSTSPVTTPVGEDMTTKPGGTVTAPITSTISIVKQIKYHKLAAIFVVLLATGAAVAGIYLYGRNPETSIESIAVLPLVNQSNDPDTEYLSDGLTESIINNLTQFPSLRVVARSSVFRYKGKEIDPFAAGRQLGVRAVLTGRLLQRGDLLVVSAELIDVSEHKQIWGDQYSRKVSDLLAVQRDIASEITGKLRIKLAGPDAARKIKDYTQDPEAYQLYLKGRYHWNKRTEPELKKAIGYFQQAIERDPNYPLPYTGIADSYIVWVISLDAGALAPLDAMPKAKAAAIRALEIDNTLSEAHTSLAMINLLYDWNWADAEREFKLALAANPNNEHAHHWYSHFLMSRGRPDESLAESKRALELAPVDVVLNVHLGWHYMMAHQYELAAEQFKRTAEMDPNFVQAPWYLGLTYEQMGMYKEAVTELERAAALSKQNTEIKAALGHAYAVTGRKAEAEQILKQLKELSTERYVSAYSIATVYLGLRDHAQALDWLEKALAARTDALVYLKADARFNELHSDPRFVDLTRRVGLAE